MNSCSPHLCELKKPTHPSACSVIWKRLTVKDLSGWNPTQVKREGARLGMQVYLPFRDGRYLVLLRSMVRLVFIPIVDVLALRAWLRQYSGGRMHCYKLVYTHAEDHNLPYKEITKTAECSCATSHCTRYIVIRR